MSEKAKLRVVVRNKETRSAVLDDIRQMVANIKWRSEKRRIEEEAREALRRAREAVTPEQKEQIAALENAIELLRKHRDELVKLRDRER